MLRVFYWVIMTHNYRWSAAWCILRRIGAIEIHEAAPYGLQWDYELTVRGHRVRIAASLSDNFAVVDAPADITAGLPGASNGRFTRVDDTIATHRVSSVGVVRDVMLWLAWEIEDANPAAAQLLFTAFGPGKNVKHLDGASQRPFVMTWGEWLERFKSYEPSWDLSGWGTNSWARYDAGGVPVISNKVVALREPVDISRWLTVDDLPMGSEVMCSDRFDMFELRPDAPEIVFDLVSTDGGDNATWQVAFKGPDGWLIGSAPCIAMLQALYPGCTWRLYIGRDKMVQAVVGSRVMGTTTLFAYNSLANHWVARVDALRNLMLQEA
jgi:hypothetical protein